MGTVTESASIRDADGETVPSRLRVTTAHADGSAARIAGFILAEVEGFGHAHYTVDAGEKQTPLPARVSHDEGVWDIANDSLRASVSLDEIRLFCDDVEVVLAPAMIWHRGTTTGYEPGAGLAFGPGGRWWTTDSEGGVVAWDGLKRRVYDARDGLPEGRAWSALTVDTEGDVWLVADTSGPPRVVRFDPAGSQATVFCSASEAAEPGCDQVAAALSAGAVCSGALVDGAGGAGAPWILCTGQHLRWNGADFDAFEAVGSLRALGATTSDGRVWLGYTGVDVGIVRVYDPGSGEVTTVQLPDVGYDFGVSGLSARGDRLFVGIVAAPEVVGSGGAVLVHDVIMGTWTAKPLDGTVALAAGVGPTGTLWATDGTTLRGRAADALEWSSAPAAIGAPGLAAGARVTPAGSLLIGALELCE